MRPETSGLMNEVHDSIIWPVLERPKAHNTLTSDTYERLIELRASMPIGGSIRTVGGRGKTFATGIVMSHARVVDLTQDALTYEAQIDAALEAIDCYSRHCLHRGDDWTSSQNM